MSTISKRAVERLADPAIRPLNARLHQRLPRVPRLPLPRLLPRLLPPVRREPEEPHPAADSDAAVAESESEQETIVAGGTREEEALLEEVPPPDDVLEAELLGGVGLPTDDFDDDDMD